MVLMGQSIQRSVLHFSFENWSWCFQKWSPTGWVNVWASGLGGFPGARSRLSLDMAVLQSSSVSDRENQTLCIRRAKLAYLFDLYNQELEIEAFCFAWTTGNQKCKPFRD